jgi:hypothetical protein
VYLTASPRRSNYFSLPTEDRPDRAAIVDDTADSEFGNLGMSREQCIHALRRTLPTRREVWHWFITLEVLAADRKRD